MTLTHLLLIGFGYVVKAAVTFVLWKRYGHRVRRLGRLARRRRRAGRPVLVRASPGERRRLFLSDRRRAHPARAQQSASVTKTSSPATRTPTPSEA